MNEKLQILDLLTGEEKAQLLKFRHLYDELAELLEEVKGDALNRGDVFISPLRTGLSAWKITTASYKPPITAGSFYPLIFGTQTDESKDIKIYKDAAVQSRFRAGQSGWYFVNCHYILSMTIPETYTISTANLYIYKNGSQYETLQWTVPLQIPYPAGGNWWLSPVTLAVQKFVYLEPGDYIDIRFNRNGVAPLDGGCFHEGFIEIAYYSDKVKRI